MSINFAVCNVSASWKLPEWENSIILVISDHGISIGEKFGERAYGAFCYDYTIKTFAYYLSKEFIPKKISQQVRHIDFMPTILDQLKINQKKSSEKIDGISLLPLINGKNFPELYAFTETGNPLENIPVFWPCGNDH